VSVAPAILDRVEDGLAAVSRLCDRPLEHVEKQRRHQRHHRRDERLVAADFKPSCFGRMWVRVVNLSRTASQSTFCSSALSTPAIRVVLLALFCGAPETVAPGPDIVGGC